MARSAALVATVALALAVLAAAGPGLPGPGTTSPARLDGWLTDAGAAAAVMALIRALGLLAGAYLLGVSLLDLAVTVTRSLTLARVYERVTVPPARRMITSATGAGLVVSLGMGSILPSLASAADPPGPPATAVTQPAPGGSAEPNLTMRRIDPSLPPDPNPAPTVAAGSPTSTSATTAAATNATTVPAGPLPPGQLVPPPTEARSWTIAPGDHLWHVAQHTVERALGRAPSDREIAEYLRTLIEANRHVLVVADNPDLVFPGQVFTLPQVPAT